MPLVYADIKKRGAREWVVKIDKIPEDKDHNSMAGPNSIRRRARNTMTPCLWSHNSTLKYVEH